MPPKSASNPFTSFSLSILKTYRWYVFGIVVAMIYAAFHLSLVPYLFKLMIDAISADTLHTSYFNVYVLAFTLIFCDLLLVAAWRLHDYCVIKSYPSIKTSLIYYFFDYVEKHSHQFFLEHHGGDTASKISDFADNFEKILENSRDIFRQSLMVLIASTMLLIVNPTFGIILIIWTILFVGITLYLSKNILPYATEYAVMRAKCSGYIVDAIANISNIRLFSRHVYEKNRLKNTLSTLSNKNEALKWKWFKCWLVMGLLYCGMLSAVLFTLLHLRAHEFISVGNFTFVLLISGAVIEPVWMLTEQISNLSESWGICKQAYTLILRPHDIKDAPNALPLNLKRGTIEFQNVSFSYAGHPSLFQNLSVSIPAGQKVGLVGLSGSGKTSFVNLMIRLYDLQQGQILIDDQAINKVSQNSLRESVGFIPQDPLLFHRTLFENISYGKPDATREEVIEASKKAHTHEFIMNTPGEYEALVGERGIKLSGGQRQRIAIARAFLKAAPILILDEATSSLDSMTEGCIQESLNILMQNRTVIIIAHRLSTLLQVDRILVFHHGKIVEDGTHQELLSKNGIYTQLWNAQVAGFLPT